MHALFEETQEKEGTDEEEEKGVGEDQCPLLDT